MADQSIEALQEKIAYQERSIEQLNDALIKQQQQITQLSDELRIAIKLMQEWRNTSGSDLQSDADATIIHEIPPHY